MGIGRKPADVAIELTNNLSDSKAAGTNAASGSNGNAEY